MKKLIALIALVLAVGMVIRCRIHAKCESDCVRKCATDACKAELGTYPCYARCERACDAECSR